MKKWAWPLALTALSLASAPALAGNGQWILTGTGMWGATPTAKCTYTKAGRTPITVRGNPVIWWGDLYQACVDAHGAKQSGEYLRSQYGAYYG